MRFSLGKIEEFDEGTELLPDEAHEDPSDFVEEVVAVDDFPDESEEPDSEDREDEEEETPPPPVLQEFIEAAPFHPHEADNTAYVAAVKAYYENKNYEQAIEKFGDAIENERRQTEGSSSDSNDIIAKSLYWQAEAYVKIQDISKSIAIFERLIQTCEGHYLTVAAKRRAGKLKSAKAVSD